MNLVQRLRDHLGSVTALRRIYRRATGKGDFRWHLALKFKVRTKTWTCRSYPGYQSRSLSTIHLIATAMEEIRREIRGSFKAVVWVGDMPPDWLFCGPHLAYAKSVEQHRTTLIPDFAFWAWPEAGIADYEDTATKMLEASQRPVLQRGVFWIGSAGKHPTRLRLLELCKRDSRIIAQNVDWIGDTWDAPSGFLQTRSNNFVSLPDHCDYQYLIDLQGSGYSARLKLLFFAGRPLFIQERRWREYFFDKLRPFEHFIPVAEDLSDLSTMLDWADSHPAEVRAIADAGQRFACENLRRHNAIAEMKKVLLELGSGNVPRQVS